MIDDDRCVCQYTKLFLIDTNYFLIWRWLWLMAGAHVNTHNCLTIYLTDICDWLFPRWQYNFIIFPPDQRNQSHEYRNGDSLLRHRLIKGDIIYKGKSLFLILHLPLSYLYNVSMSIFSLYNVFPGHSLYKISMSLFLVCTLFSLYKISVRLIPLYNMFLIIPLVIFGPYSTYIKLHILPVFNSASYCAL